MDWLLIAAAIVACVACVASAAAIMWWYHTPTAAALSGPALSGPALSGPVAGPATGPALSAASPAITSDCVFCATFVIPSASGQSGKAGPTVTNPFKRGADPGIVTENGWYYMSSTMSPLEKSQDLVKWQPGGKMEAGRTYWAPEMVRIGGVWWCLFCDGLNAGCHALRSSGGIEGPWQYSHAIPVQPPMDPSVFVDVDGKCYIVTSSVGAGGTLSVHEISADLRQVGKGAVIAKVHAQPSWMREPVAEGGQIICRVAGGKRTYYAIFSGNGCCKPAGQNFYAVGYATAPHPMGPWTLAPENPILGDAKSGVGYGHGCVYKSLSGNLGYLYQQETASRDLCVSRAWFDASGRLKMEPPEIGKARPSP